MIDGDFMPMDPMGHIDGDTEPEHVTVNFEVDLEPEQVLILPRIYPKPGELARPHGTLSRHSYWIVIERDALLGRLAPEVLAQVRVSPIPLGRSDGPTLAVPIGSNNPPEVKTLIALTGGRYAPLCTNTAMDRVITELQRLDARNIVRDHLFMDRRLRLGVTAHEFEMGGYGRTSHSGMALALRWIAVEV